MRKIKLMALLLATLMIVSAFAGCAGVKKEELDALDVRVQALEDLLNGQQKDLEDIKNQIADIDNSEVLDAIESIKTDLEDKIKDVNDRVDDEVGKADTSVTVSDAVKTEQQKALAKIEVQRAAYTTNSYKYSKENYEKISEALGTATGAVNAATTVEGVAKALAAMDAELKKYLTYQDMAYKYYVDLLGNVNVDAEDLVNEAKDFLKEVKAVYDEPVKFTGTMDLNTVYEDNEIDGYVAELAFFAKEGTSRARDQYIDMYNAVFVLCELYSGSVELTRDLYYVNAKGKVDVKTLKTVAGYKKDAEDLVDVIGKVVGDEGIVYSQVSTSNFKKVGATYNKYEAFVDGAMFLGGQKLVDLVTNAAEIIAAAETVKLLEEAAEEFLKVVRVSAKKEADPFYFYDQLIANNAERLLESDLDLIEADGITDKKDVWVADIYEDVEDALADWVAEFELSDANKLAIIAFIKDTRNWNAGVYDVNGTNSNYNYYGQTTTARTVVTYLSNKHVNDLLVEAYNSFKTTIAEKIIELNNIPSANVTMVQLYEEIKDLYADFFELQEATTARDVVYPENIAVNLYNGTSGAHQYDGSKNMIVILRDSGIFDEYAEERLEVVFDATIGGLTETEAQTEASTLKIVDDPNTTVNEVTEFANSITGKIKIKSGYYVDRNKDGKYYIDANNNGKLDGTETEAYKNPDAIRLLDLYTFDSDRRTLELDRINNNQIYFNAVDTDEDVATYLKVTDNRRNGVIYTFFVETYPAICVARDYINDEIENLADQITINNNEAYVQLEGEFVKITTENNNATLTTAGQPLTTALTSGYALGNIELTYSGTKFNNASDVYVPVTDVYDREYIDLDGNKKDNIYTPWDANANGTIETGEFATHFEAYLNTMRPTANAATEATTGFWTYTLKNATNGINYKITIKAFKELYADFVALLDLDVFEADKAAKAKLLDDLFAEGLNLVVALSDIDYVRTWTIGSTVANTVYVYDDVNGNGKFDAATETATAFAGSYLVNLSHEQVVNTIWDRLVAWRKLGGDHTLKRFVAYTDGYNKTYANVFHMEGFTAADAIKVKQTGETIENLYKQIVALKDLANKFINTVAMAEKIHGATKFVATINTNNVYSGNVIGTSTTDTQYFTWVTKELKSIAIGANNEYRSQEGDYTYVGQNGSWYVNGGTLKTYQDATTAPVTQLSNAAYTKEGFLKAAVGHYRTFEAANVTYIGASDNDYVTTVDTTGTPVVLYYALPEYAPYAPFDAAADKYAAYDLIAVKGYLLNKLATSANLGNATEGAHILTLVRSIDGAKTMAEVERLIKSHDAEVKADSSRNQNLIVYLDAADASGNAYAITLSGRSIYNFEELAEELAR